MINVLVTIEAVESPSVRVSIREAAAQPVPTAPEETSSEPRPLILYGAPSTTAGTTDLRLAVPGALALR
jgi:hypothetical protein